MLPDSNLAGVILGSVLLLLLSWCSGELLLSLLDLLLPMDNVRDLGLATWGYWCFPPGYPVAPFPCLESAHHETPPSLHLDSGGVRARPHGYPRPCSLLSHV